MNRAAVFAGLLSGANDSRPSAMHLPPGTLLAASFGASRKRTYRVDEQLGAGSFGSVVRATPVYATRARPVIIKIMRLDDPTAFLAEATMQQWAVAAGLCATTVCVRRAAWVRVVDDGAADVLYGGLIMTERGVSLRTFIRQHPGAFRANERRIFAQIGQGILALHRAGIAHLDLKPDNLLVMDTSPVAVKIIDLGISCIYGAKRAQIRLRPSTHLLLRHPWFVHSGVTRADLERAYDQVLDCRKRYGTPKYYRRDELDQPAFSGDVQGQMRDVTAYGIMLQRDSVSYRRRRAARWMQEANNPAKLDVFAAFVAELGQP